MRGLNVKVVYLGWVLWKQLSPIFIPEFSPFIANLSGNLFVMEQQKEANGHSRPMEDVASDQYSALPTTGDRAQLIPGQVAERTSASSAESGTEVSPLQMDLGKKSTRCRADGLNVIIISAISFSVALTVALVLTIYFGPPQVPPHGAVSCDSPLCAQVGSDILKKGGSAVDAAIAATFCLTVVNPFSASIGGGGFLILRDNKNNHSMSINAREAAPTNQYASYTPTSGKSGKTAGMSVAVPGLVKGLELAHKEHGSLPWSDLLQPAIIIANDTGFNVTKAFVESLAGITSKNTKAFPTFHTFLMQLNSIPYVDEIFYNRPLADTLSLIARDGATALYDGPLATDIVETVEASGGVLTLEDMEAYRAERGEPLEIKFNRTVVQSVPAPGGGPIVLMILNVLQALQENAHNHSYIQDLHWFLEAQKFSAVEAGSLGDPATDPVVATVTERMISKQLAQLLANVSDLSTHDASWYSDQLSTAINLLPDRGTSTVTVMGTNEDMVAISLSMGRPWGSKVMTRSGIILNDQMNSFTDKKHSNNKDGAGKRPASFMAPSLVFSRDKPCGMRMVVGGGGGQSVPAAVSQIIINTLQYGQDVQPAIRAPRVYADLTDNTVLYEDLGKSWETLSEGMVEQLDQYGHQMEPVSTPWSTVNAAAKINETVRAYGDPRNGGGRSVF